jgi:hypothetical protein
MRHTSNLLRHRVARDVRPLASDLSRSEESDDVRHSHDGIGCEKRDEEKKAVGHRGDQECRREKAGTGSAVDDSTRELARRSASRS